MHCDDTGATVECDIPRVGPRQLVDDGVRRPTEDSWETTAERRFLLQAQVSLHHQREHWQSYAAVRRESARQLGQSFILQVLLYAYHLCQQRHGCSFWPTVCITVRSVLADRCLSVLSMRLVYCGQTVGRIKMELGVQVGLGPGHIVLRPNGCMDQDATWYGGRPWPRPHCVRLGPSFPFPKGAQPPIFGPCVFGPMVDHLSYCWALVDN